MDQYIAIGSMVERRRMLLVALLLLSSSAVAAERVDGRQTNSVRMRRRRRTQNHHHQRNIIGTTDDKQSTQSHYHRGLSTKDCDAATEKSFVLNFQTDSYGSETSWFLRREDSSTNEYIGYGPPEGVQYGDITIYSYSYCLTIGSTYTLAMEDNFGDGMCCNRGVGGYEYLIDGVRIYTSNLQPTFKNYIEHTFTIDTVYNSIPSDAPTSESVEMECISNPNDCGCDDIMHEDYRGTISTTESGYTCQGWDEQSPHVHTYTSTTYPNGDLISNYCRSPTGEWPWCFTTNPDVEWEYCRIPSCPTQLKVSTPKPSISPTLPRGPTTNSPSVSPVNSPTLAPSTSPSKSPTKLPTLQPTSKPTPNVNVLNPANGCYGGDIKLQVEVRADQYSSDTSWELLRPDGSRALHQIADFKENEYKSQDICLPHGKYTFIIYDEYGDGFCCRYGEGFFRINLDGRNVLNGGSFNENVTATINVGFEPEGYMTQREFEYLEAHNVRRKDWHERYNLTYVPLVYSPSLAKDSKAWAEELLYSCGIVGIEHESFVPHGENLAKNTGNPEKWGQLYPPESIVNRWVDFEIGLAYPSNGHLTQALWRASKYLGCGESEMPFRGGICRVQVCRYSRAGNCDMTRYNSTEGENWLEPMLDNYTRCGPDCPDEGCY